MNLKSLKIYTGGSNSDGDFVYILLSAKGSREDLIGKWRNLLSCIVDLAGLVGVSGISLSIGLRA